MRKSFFEYIVLREGISSEVKLSDDSDYKPFIVSDEHHPNLKVIVQAFLDSQKVALPGPDGYPQKITTLDVKGESTPKLKKKLLYLVGGAVRDHLLGKTPKNYDLATDATPDEIRLILRAAGFSETKPKNTQDKRYQKYPETGSNRKTFSAGAWDRSGREFTVHAKVNGEQFEIATLRKNTKGKNSKIPDRVEFTPNFEEDASSRDFTINAMAIPLTSADGPNAKLVDPHGGAHHLKNGDVKFIGDPKQRLQEDELRALRFIRFAAKSKNPQIPPEYKEAIEEIKHLPNSSREQIKDEFVKGLEHPDVDPKNYISLYKQTGLLPTIFPGMSFKLDDSKDFTDKKDKRLVVAWILRHNNPDDVKEMLSHGTWNQNDINDIIHLIKLTGWAAKYGKDDSFFDDFYDMKSNLHTKTNLVPSLIRTWAKMTNIDDQMIHNYIDHELSTKSYVKDNFGGRTVNPELVKFLGKVPEGKEFAQSIKNIETQNFKKRFKNESGI
jgi:tRNA nucleotidyltransferase/poly(A) polymerase